MIGTPSWQRIRTQKIEYYFTDEARGPRGSLLGYVEIPTALLREPQRAPLLYRGVVELTAPTRQLPLDNSADGNIFRPDVVGSVLTGLIHYVTLIAGERTGFVETAPYELGWLRDIDALCVSRMRATGPAMILPHIGAAGRPLWGADLAKYQPAFEACSTSFTKFLIDESGLDRVLGLMARMPDGAKAVHAEMERITGRPIATLRTEWQRKIGASP